MSIIARDVRRTFGDHVAVAHADVDVAPGRITGLIGPNGSGKTTLLLVLAGLLAPDAGSVEVAGADPSVDGLRARARIGWMPDHVGTWETLTSHEIVASFGRLYGLSRGDADARATELLAEVGLSEFAGQRVRVLSRGQKQRLSLARALVHDPAVLLLDEPASGLDPDSRVALRRILRRRADAGAAIIVSSHILPERCHIQTDQQIGRHHPGNNQHAVAVLPSRGPIIRSVEIRTLELQRIGILLHRAHSAVAEAVP